MYSIMLYMKTRVTFRVAPDLADVLRQLPNQTQFVEAALRDALGVTCPLCDGSGRFRSSRLKVSNFRTASLPTLERGAALELKRLVRVGRELVATRLELQKASHAQGMGFVLLRGEDVLLRGSLKRSRSTC